MPLFGIKKLGYLLVVGLFFWSYITITSNNWERWWDCQNKGKSMLPTFDLQTIVHLIMALCYLFLAFSH